VYNLFFYHIYRTSRIRRGDSVFDGALIMTTLLTMHGYILFSVVEIVLYLLFRTSIRHATSIGGLLVPIIVFGSIFLVTYGYYRRNVQHIVHKYEERYAGISHWRGFSYSALFFFGSIVFMVFALVLARSVQGLAAFQR